MKRITLALQTPYVGLRPFSERDAVLFFGRDQHVRELLTKLEGKQRLIAVLGASGTGKSSLVRAGLVPALHRGALASAGYDWNVCIFKPGDAPLSNLAQALTEHPSWRDSANRADAVASLSAALAMSPLALTELYRQKAQALDGQALLLIVDQFEEIFRYRQKNVDEAEAFINLLLRSASEEMPIYIVMTMRSDFLGNCVAFFGLPESINRGIYLTPRLGPDQLKSIIASPLALVGGWIDPILVNKLVNTLEGEDELPIMEHALLRMWNRARTAGRSRLETEDFETVCASHNGQVGQARLTYAIDNHASEIYNKALSTQQQVIARQVFLTMVERREGREVRRPQTIKQLVELIGEQERANLLVVIEAFRAEQVGFLLPAESMSLTDDRMIDITHESLFRQWHLFQQWLAEEDADVAELKEWQQRAERQREGRGWLDAYDCERAQRWLARINKRADPVQWATRYGGSVKYEEVNRYIDESLARVTQAKAEQERLEREANQAQIRQLSSQCQYAVTRVLYESRTLTEAMSQITQAIGEILEWKLGIFWQLNRQKGALQYLGHHWQAVSLSSAKFVEGLQHQTFTPGVGLPGRIWESGQPVWIRDVTLDPDFSRTNIAIKAGLRGAFGFPIHIGGEIEGVIEFFSHEVREPDRELLHMIADIGLKIGQFGERTRAEEALHQTEVQLRQAQKMEAVGRLAGGVAHDFNNLLTVIRGYSELVLGRLKPGDSSQREMEEVKKAADRAANLTGQLLAFSRRQFVATKVVDLNTIVMNMDGMLRRLLGEDIIEICTDLDPQVGAIKADPGQIEQVIMNLAVNARDAMPAGGRLTIETRNVTIKNDSERDERVLEEGAYVLLVIKDTGHGMSEETQAHLFEPFFTTKEKGKGTGLGLSTVYGIVKQSGGVIAIESKLQQGTACKIFFPKVDEAVEDMQNTSGEMKRWTGQETILVVEDDPAVRRLVQQALSLSGYEVLVARHGIEALLTGAKYMGPIHLLLTDVAMPQMSGPEAAEKLKKVRPQMKVLYMSGYPDHPLFKQVMGQHKASFIQKPFSVNTLTQKVRAVLDDAKVFLADQQV
jgi:two-component system cell cycle sensor histidine kinase/response regulator CckA